MGMMDDTISVTEIGHKTQQMNAYFNVKTAEKKLQFSELKCHKMVIQKSKKNNPGSDLKVDIWKQSHDKRNVWGKILEGDHILTEVILQEN